MKDIHICLATDETYAPYCGVTIVSAIKNKLKNEVLNIYILNQRISDASKKHLESLACEGCNINLIDIDRYECVKMLNDMPITKGTHLTAETYFRIIIPDIFSDLDRVLYLDCDILIRGSLSELFHMDMQGKLLAMAKAYGYTGKRNDHFNAGIILIDCKKWRDHKITEFLIEFVDRADKTGELDLSNHDQDLINYALMDQIYEISYKWNRQVFLDSPDELYYKQDDKILHFLTYAKPWHGVYQNPLTDEYFQYLYELPWGAKDNRRRNASIDAHKYYQCMISLRSLLASTTINLKTPLVIIEVTSKLAEFEYAALDLKFLHVSIKNLNEINEKGEKDKYYLSDRLYDAEVKSVLDKKGYHSGKDYSFLRTVENGIIESELKKKLELKMLNGLKAAIYGTGEWAQKYTEVLTRNGADIDFYIDSNIEKEGQVFCGKKIISPSNISEKEPEIEIIFLASSFHQEMKETLLTLGVRADKIMAPICIEASSPKSQSCLI